MPRSTVAYGFEWKIASFASILISFSDANRNDDSCESWQRVGVAPSKSPPPKAVAVLLELDEVGGGRALTFLTGSGHERC